MSEYKIFSAETSRYGQPGIIIITSYRNPGGYDKAESFLVIPGEENILISKKIEFNRPSFEGSPVTLDDEFKFGEALDQAKIDLGQYLESKATSSPLNVPSGINVIESKDALIVNAWFKGNVSHIKNVLEKTGSNDLLELLEMVTHLPILKSTEI